MRRARFGAARCRFEPTEAINSEIMRGRLRPLPDIREVAMRGFLKVALLSSVFAVSSYAAEAETLKLGVLATLSGAGTAWGIAMQGAAELAAEDVNSKGGLEVGGKKYRIEVIAYDDHYKAADALTAFNRLVFDDGIKYVVGPLGSAPALALLPV